LQHQFSSQLQKILGKVVAGWYNGPPTEDKRFYYLILLQKCSPYRPGEECFRKVRLNCKQ
jgi:hypothetical protein